MIFPQHLHGTIHNKGQGGFPEKNQRLTTAGSQPRNQGRWEAWEGTRRTNASA